MRPMVIPHLGLVIPREGVESNLVQVMADIIIHHVIPREGVESPNTSAVSPKISGASDPERGS